MEISEHAEKYPDESDKGKRFWVAGAEFGKNATSRMSRKVEPTLVEVDYGKSKSYWQDSVVRNFHKVSKKTDNKLASTVVISSYSWKGNPIKIFDKEEECRDYWATLNQELAIEALREASQVASVYLEAFDKYNKSAGKYKMDREDALAIMKI